jgi:hypothetical protein
LKLVPARIFAFVVIILSFSAAVAIAGDSLVIVGAGYAPPWDTDLVFANGESEERTVWVGPSRSSLSPCLSCPGVSVLLPSDGTAKTTAQNLFFYASFIGVTTVYVVPPSGSSLPTVTARVVNRARPGQSIELPVVRYSTIEALNPAVLSFPAATRSPDSHSNLFVAEVSREQGRGLSVLVEAYSSAGDRLGSTAFVLSNGTTLFLIDVLARLGVASVDGGQIRVTKTGGTGLMWGLLATVSDDGRVSVSPGLNP